ncbi:hypothetical protein IQ17_07260 [Bradyrhizobium daqingense]|uniref:Uncharacterized protein n=1 Tax=Bradyrhizobium daqingense TaxID=993502 RepID=A0A562K9I6_9BRAD|nr:hypothetical protein IQ17_07260 [Bradyrhizobium daqingense]
MQRLWRSLKAPRAMLGEGAKSYSAQGYLSALVPFPFWPAL